MTSAERSVLILGDELSFVDRFVPLLRRSNFTVRKLLRPTDAAQLVLEGGHDLVIAVWPLANAAKVLGTLRAEGSPLRHTQMLLIADRSSQSARDPAILRLASQVLPLAATPEQFHRAVADLLRVSPRVAVRASVRLKLVGTTGEPRISQVENLSSTGMLLRSDEVLPVGAVFGFALELPSQPEPVRGQACVVRQAPAPDAGGHRIAARFLSVGGDGTDRIERLARELAPDPRRITPATARALSTSSSGAVELASTVDLQELKKELTEINALLDELLSQGLARRLGVADWYLTGMELGLESLRAFGAILESVHSGRATSPDAASRIADFADVRVKLAEFARPNQELKQRVRILLELRPAMERLLRELAESGAVASGELSRTRLPGVVSQVLVDIKRLLGVRKSLESVRALLLDLGSPKFLFARGAQRRIAQRLCRDYRAHTVILGIDDPERLLRRKGRKAALAAVTRELAQAEHRVKMIHERVYTRKFAEMASGDRERDLLDPGMVQILSDTLAAGHDYLVRAFSAYRHALEVAGANPGLLDRASTLEAKVRAAEREPGRLPHFVSPAATGRGA